MSSRDEEHSTVDSSGERSQEMVRTGSVTTRKHMVKLTEGLDKSSQALTRYDKNQSQCKRLPKLISGTNAKVVVYSWYEVWGSHSERLAKHACTEVQRHALETVTHERS